MRRYSSNTLLLAVCAALAIGGCEVRVNPSHDEVVSHFENYFGDLYDQYEFETISLPRQGGSEGSAFTVYQDTGTVSVLEIEGFITYGVWVIRLFSEEDYPNLLFIRRQHWNPDLYPDELVVEYDKTSFFVQDGRRWVTLSNNAEYPEDRLPRVIERFEAAAEYLESQQ